jgi:DNA-binding transcriptional MerR regulator
MAEYLVGELAARTGFSRSTIRYYESIGLLAPAVRAASGYRVYAQKALDELRFVRRAQRLGFTLEEMTEVLRLHRQGLSPCRRVVQAAQTRLSAV